MRKLFLLAITGLMHATMSQMTTCQGTTWYATSLPHDTLQSFAIHFSNKDSGFVGTLLGELFKTTDGATTWQQVVPGLSFPTGIRSIIYTNDGSWIVSSLNGIKSSSDFGMSWNSMKPPPSGMFDVMDCWFADAQNGIVVVQRSIVSVTSDGGESWGDLHINQDGVPNWSCVGISKEYAYCVGDLLGRLLVSTDSGTSWVYHEVEEMIWKRVRFLDDTTIIAMGNKEQDRSPTISISRDKGQSWKDMIVDSVGSLLALDFVDVNHGIIISSSGSGYFTFDGGRTWTKQDITQGMASLDDVCVVDDSVAYAVGPNLILRTNSNRPTSVANKDQHREHTDNVSIYPNPASEYITIRCANPINTTNKIAVTICTANGEELLSQSSGVVGGEVRINVSTLSNGPYVACISSNEVNETVAFIICR